MISLKPHQLSAIPNLKTGSILCGGVGSGKSITSLVYFLTIECKGQIHTKDHDSSVPEQPKDLFIITTPKKRDSLEWEKECSHFMLSKDRSCSIGEILVTVDSWNNIGKYIETKNCFFIFDEQRVIGSGAWVKSFLKITKQNNWLLLSATPGDTWIDYIPVFIANGFYKNRTEFLRRHVVYNSFSRFPKVDHYVEVGELNKLKISTLVAMPYDKLSTNHYIDKTVMFDKEQFDIVDKKRWNPFTDTPVKQVVQLGYLMRRVVNSDPDRLRAVREIYSIHKKLIIFYNFNYELDILLGLKEDLKVPIAQYNGHKHEPIPKSDSWIYLVQYTSGAEGWNCIESNAILFYSLNYSYRIMTQSAGRIDRMNTLFNDLYYYRLISNSDIDMAIKNTIKEKRDFNELSFILSRQKHRL